jgi:thermitase
MSYLRCFVYVLILAGNLALTCTSPLWGQSALPPGARVPDELLISPANNVPDDELQGIYRAHDGDLLSTIAQIRVHRIRIAPQAIDQVESALRNNPKIKFVERNYLAQSGLTPNDPGYPSQWHLLRISAAGAWDYTTGASSVPIAIIDSGVDPAHPDLASKLIGGYNFLGGNTDIHDVLGHGTAVAGTAAALTNDGIGGAGVGWSNPIMPLVVLNSSNYATYSDIASAITFAADHGAKVINISIYGSSYSTTLQSAVDYAWNKGVVIVACAGNDSSSTAVYPAALNHVVAVAATDATDAKAGFSNYGTWISVAAPGDNIYTTVNGGTYGYWYGTSFASPQVAGLAALILSRNSSLTNQQVVDLIKNNSDDLGAPGFDQYFGYGRINAYRALAATPLSTLKAYYLGITGEDKAGPGGQLSPNGIADFHIQAQNLRGTPTRVRITSDTGGIWEIPYNGSNWSIFSQYDGLGDGDFWFEPWPSQSFHFKVWYSNGMTDETDAINQTTIVPPPPPPPPPPPTDTTAPTVVLSSVQYDGSRWLSVNVSASDSGTGVTKVELYADGKLQATATTAPYAFRINIRSWSKGNHAIQAKAYDGAGNSAWSNTATITK